MAPYKNNVMEKTRQMKSNTFGPRPPDVIPMLSYMKDHKTIEFLDKDGGLSDDAPFSSSTLIKDSNQKSQRVTLNEKQNSEENDFEEDSLENLDIGHLEIASKPIEGKDTASTEEILKTNHRKLPSTPTAMKKNMEDNKINEKQKRRPFWRSYSLPLSPFSGRKHERSVNSPNLKRQTNSLRERLRQSVRKRVIEEDYDGDNPFPVQREHHYYELAKKRGRRGAVISLEVNQSVSLVRPNTKEDKFLEFNFLPHSRPSEG